jgi:hypothetical protein
MHDLEGRGGQRPSLPANAPTLDGKTVMKATARELTNRRLLVRKENKMNNQSKTKLVLAIAVEVAPRPQNFRRG